MEQSNLNEASREMDLKETKMAPSLAEEVANSVLYADSVTSVLVSKLFFPICFSLNQFSSYKKWYVPICEDVIALIEIYRSVYQYVQSALMTNPRNMNYAVEHIHNVHSLYIVTSWMQTAGFQFYFLIIPWQVF